MMTTNELGISPAPWDYQPHNPQGITVADRGNWTICVLSDKADARLIAAAPELYEALRLCISGMCQYCREKFPSETCVDGCERIRRAKAALAKAAGKEAAE